MHEMSLWDSPNPVTPSHEVMKPSAVDRNVIALSASTVNCMQAMKLKYIPPNLGPARLLA